uniref:Uncharacterized protein n=1 Tax=Chelonoidis abingdonii TaxID=106734 RepID=A0A8C0H528_CHEAB
MLSDELESKLELLVQFVQNISIPLGRGLTSQCNRLMLPDDSPNHTNSSKDVPFSPSDRTSFILLNLTRGGPGCPAEYLVFVQDEAEDSGSDFISHDSTDSSTSWFL